MARIVLKYRRHSEPLSIEVHASMLNVYHVLNLLTLQCHSVANLSLCGSCLVTFFLDFKICVAFASQYFYYDITNLPICDSDCNV